MIRLFISFLFSIWSLCLFAEEQYILRVWLKDKERGEYSLSRPDEFLSDRCIYRHTKNNIVITERDLPISPQYKTEIEKVANRLVCHSKWLNSLVIECDSSKVSIIEHLPFVKQIEFISRKSIENIEYKSNFYSVGNIKQHPKYGASYPIVKAVKANKLHKRGVRGEGAYIAVLDDGFGGVDTLEMWFDKERIKFECDVVNPGGDIYKEDDHGTAVLSIMLAMREGEYIGVAPLSDYALIRTEDIRCEAAYEEDLFVRGLEIADSLGVDIINASLGYGEFGDIISVSTLASEIATEKGIIVVTSCGNRGDRGFTHPADAKGVIAVGGINKQGRVSKFTSREVVNGKYIAPKEKALAEDVSIINGSGKIMTTYGTSFASPAVAGAKALEMANRFNK